MFRLHFCLGIFFLHYTFLWIRIVYIFALYLYYTLYFSLHTYLIHFQLCIFFFYTFCISASLLCIFCTLMSITCTRTLLCIFVLSIFYFAVSLSKHFRALPCFIVIFCYTYLMLWVRRDQLCIYHAIQGLAMCIFLSWYTLLCASLQRPATHASLFRPKLHLGGRPYCSVVFNLPNYFSIQVCWRKYFFLSCNKSFIMVRWDALKQSRLIKCYEKVLKGVGLNWNIWSAVKSSVESKRDGW